MKIAITADNHLTTKEKNPERFRAFENVLSQCGDLGVELLIIAGDLFDQAFQNYSDFEKTYQEYKPDKLQSIVIPGNHDQDLTNEILALPDLKVYSGSDFLELNDNWGILLIPYKREKTMGEEIAVFANQLSSTHWILVGHGDWAEGLRSPNPYEPGVYMPLTRADLNNYNPSKVFLGHIHRPFNDSYIHYPGSPCPLHINETGTRRFLVFDTKSQEMAPQIIDSPHIFFNEQFVLLPVEDEIGYLTDLIRERIASWNLPEGWEEKVHVRVQVRGYAVDRSAVVDTVETLFSPYNFYDDRPCFDELYHRIDPNLAHIARQAKRWIEELEWRDDPSEPTKEDILVEALKVIYGA